MGTKLSELDATTVIAATDIFHLRTSGGVDKKITGTNFGNSFFIPKAFRALLQVQLTEYTSLVQPGIAAGGVVEINGSVYINPSEVAITGATVNDTWYDILLTPSGSSFTASFIARGTGVWSDSKQGLYSGNNRVVACAYRIASDNWVNKNILKVINRTVKIKIEIGDWDMVATATLTLTHVFIAIFSGLRSVAITIRNDQNTSMYSCAYAGDITVEIDIHAVLSSSGILIYRLTAGKFDGGSYDSTSYNRGWITVEYEV